MGLDGVREEVGVELAGAACSPARDRWHRIMVHDPAKPTLATDRGPARPGRCVAGASRSYDPAYAQERFAQLGTGQRGTKVGAGADADGTK